MKYLLLLFIIISGCNTASNNKVSIKPDNTSCIIIKELSDEELANKSSKDVDYIETYSDFIYYSGIFIDSIAINKSHKIIRIKKNNRIPECSTNLEFPDDFGIVFVKGNKHLLLNDILTEMDYFDLYKDFFMNNSK